LRSILRRLRQLNRCAASYGAGRLENFESLAGAQGSETRRFCHGLLKRAVFVWHGGVNTNAASLIAAAEYKESAADDFIQARLRASSSRCCCGHVGFSSCFGRWSADQAGEAVFVLWRHRYMRNSQQMSTLDDDKNTS
jgi:hypothetical protein